MFTGYCRPRIHDDSERLAGFDFGWTGRDAEFFPHGVGEILGPAGADPFNELAALPEPHFKLGVVFVGHFVQELVHDGSEYPAVPLTGI
jgi:hypothetical protein